jgi:hypothetical protein
MAKMTEAQAGAAFWATIVRHLFGHEITILDGGEFQDIGMALGLLKLEEYDPRVHGKNSYCDPGDPYYCQTEVGDALYKLGTRFIPKDYC